jgi:hypothetical protein
MAEIGGSYLYKGTEAMSLIEHQARQPTVKKSAGVRVRLERINCDVSRSLPPDGDRQVWIDRLKVALGTASMEFVLSTLFQLQAAARLPNSGVSEIAVNSALAMIESEQPRNETDGSPGSHWWRTRW